MTAPKSAKVSRIFMVPFVWCYDTVTIFKPDGLSELVPSMNLRTISIQQLHTCISISCGYHGREVPSGNLLL